MKSAALRLLELKTGKDVLEDCYKQQKPNINYTHYKIKWKFQQIIILRSNRASIRYFQSAIMAAWKC